MRRVFVDTNVLLFAFGEDHPLRNQCVQLIEACRMGAVELHASTDIVQEFVFHRMRRGSTSAAVRQARAVARMLILHSHSEATVFKALDLIEHHGMKGRDAMIAATAQAAGFSVIVSADKDFDSIPGLTRTDASAVTW